MHCVACKAPMVVLELDEVEIDYCPACRGIWLDAGELELLFENEADVKRLLGGVASGSSVAGQRRCPICRKKMRLAGIPTKTEIQIDYCLQNHGLWFDRGELDDIAAYIEGGDQGRVKTLLQAMFNR